MNHTKHFDNIAKPYIEMNLKMDALSLEIFSSKLKRNLITVLLDIKVF